MSPRLALTPLLLALLCTGCGRSHLRLHRALEGDTNPAARSRDPEARYAVRTPDVLDVAVAGRPDLSGRKGVDTAGRVALDAATFIDAEGHTCAKIARDVAAACRVPEASVRVRVADYRSREIYVYGESEAKAHVTAYRGPETIVDLLHRHKPGDGADLGEIRIVRAHVADGRPPEVFNVDLEAILLKRDLQTNIRLEPFDRVHIGRSRRAGFLERLPPVLRPREPEASATDSSRERKDRR